MANYFFEKDLKPKSVVFMDMTISGCEWAVVYLDIT
jgi:hypothetical protein